MVNDVFGVITNNGNYAKVQIQSYGYNLQIRWITYHLNPRYEVLGTGYNMPEDIKVSSDETTAYVTERVGNLLRVDLTNANRAMATVVTGGLTAPHGIMLDNSNQAYVVEFANPGRLLRIDSAQAPDHGLEQPGVRYWSAGHQRRQLCIRERADNRA